MSPDECLTSPTAILLDGANGMCNEARAETGIVRAPYVAAFTGLAIVFAVLLAARVRYSRAIVIGAAVVAAVPGAYAMLAVRADRPPERSATAATSMRLHDELRRFGLAQGCARVLHDRCEACLPAAQLALLDLACGDPAIVELHADALDAQCTAAGRTLSCGAP